MSDPNQTATDRENAHWEHAVESGLLLLRGTVLIPVVVLALSALGTYLYGIAFFVHSAVDIARHPFPIDHNIGRFLLLVDVFLIGTTLLITAIGLYELFISEVEVGGRRGLPGWLEIHDLNDLKARIIAMLALVASVSFVDKVEAYAGGRDILYVGAAIALVVAALTAFQRFGKGHA